MGQLLPGVQPLVSDTREQEVIERIKVWWKFHQHKKAGRISAYRFNCTYEGCKDEVSLLRFLLVGCICKPHAWIQRWGG